MRITNSVWIKGKENKNQVVEALLQSGYQVKIDLDFDSQALTGTPCYLITFLNEKHTNCSFEIVDDDGNVMYEYDGE